MTEINFCPYCDAPSHKLVLFNKDQLLCKTCNRFFELKHSELLCPKCKSKKISGSDFPMASGEMVLQCNSCKKMFSTKEFFEFNKIPLS